MAHLNFFHICNDAFLTEGSHMLNVIGIFDRLNVKAVPTVIPKMALAMGITALEGPHDLTISLKKNNVVLGKGEGKYTGSNHHHIHHFLGMGFKEAGEYLFEISVDNEIIGTKRFDIVVVNAT